MQYFFTALYSVIRSYRATAAAMLPRAVTFMQRARPCQPPPPNCWCKVLEQTHANIWHGQLERHGACVVSSRIFWLSTTIKLTRNVDQTFNHAQCLCIMVPPVSQIPQSIDTFCQPPPVPFLCSLQSVFVTFWASWRPDSAESHSTGYLLKVKILKMK